MSLRPTEQLVVISKVRYGYVHGVQKPMLTFTITGLTCDTSIGLHQADVESLVGSPHYIEDVFSLKGKTCVVRYEDGLFRFVRMFP